MQALTARLTLLLIVIATFVANCGAQRPPLSMVTRAGQSGVVGKKYSFQLQVAGGIPPYEWRLINGKLPPGLHLNPTSGLISGVPTTPGEFRFSILSSDAGIPSARVEREFVISIALAFTVDWQQSPHVDGESITGQVVVKNQTGSVLDLTVIILAVNGVNKAFALGYQHFDLKPENATPTIPFGSALPFGSYIIHVDAIGEVASTKTIYRARRQTQRALVISQR